LSPWLQPLQGDRRERDFPMDRHRCRQ
jgi:hypothetical protein